MYLSERRSYRVTLAVLGLALGIALGAAILPGKTTVSYFKDSATGCWYVVARMDGSISITPRQLTDGVQLCLAPDIERTSPHQPKRLPPFNGRLGSQDPEWERSI